MDSFAAQQQLTTSAAGHPSVPKQAGRGCVVLFGRLESVARIVSDPQGGKLPVCEVDLDVILNDALDRAPRAAWCGWRSGWA
jgi:hypothetical protein